MHWNNFPNRTLCDTLGAMRDQVKHTNLLTYKRTSIMIAQLIEEAQCYGNRMESGLADWSDMRYARECLSKLKKETKELDEQIKAQKALLDKPKKKSDHVWLDDVLEEDDD